MDVACVERQVRRVALLDAEELPSVGEGSVTLVCSCSHSCGDYWCRHRLYMRSMLLTFAFAEHARDERMRERGRG
jgi:hypothetical protein